MPAVKPVSGSLHILKPVSGTPSISAAATRVSSLYDLGSVAVESSNHELGTDEQ